MKEFRLLFCDIPISVVFVKARLTPEKSLLSRDTLLMPSDEKASMGARSVLLPLLDRYRLVLLGLAFASWGVTYIAVAFSAWDHNLSFVKAIAAGNILFIWALGLFGWIEFQHAIRRSTEPGRFIGRTKRYSPKKYLFSLAFFTGYAAGALIVAPYVWLRIAFS